MAIVRVYHEFYGCDTGCCGHVVEVSDGVPEGEGYEDWKRTSFSFDHPDTSSARADTKVWARGLAEREIRAKWPGCLDSIDWNSLTVEASSD